MQNLWHAFSRNGAIPGRPRAYYRRLFGVTLLLGSLGMSFGLAADLDQQPPAPPSNVRIVDGSATLTGLSVSGPTSVTVGQTAQYSATVTYSDGSSQSVTSGPTWSTSNSGLATINAAGVLTAIAAGTATVAASYTYGGVTRTTNPYLNQPRRADADRHGLLCQPVGLGFEPGHAKQPGPDDSAGRHVGQSGERGQRRHGVDCGGDLS